MRTCRAGPSVQRRLMRKYQFRIPLQLFPFVFASLWFFTAPASAQSPAALPRTADGEPNLNGIWQVLNTAAWDIQDHGGELGIPPGLGVVEGGEIPYQSQALAKKEQNRAKRMTADPAEANCFLPGVPRASICPIRSRLLRLPITSRFVTNSRCYRK